jgi:hypothetical protein
MTESAKGERRLVQRAAVIWLSMCCLLRRGRLKLKLVNLEHKLNAVHQQEAAARWEQVYLQQQDVLLKHADRWARVPKLISSILVAPAAACMRAKSLRNHRPSV